MKHVVDTHTPLWHLQGNARLGLNAKAALQDHTSGLVLPATAYGEAWWIVEHGRIPTLTVADVQAAINADARIVIYPLSQMVIDKSQSLTAIPEMHDRRIVATALVLADAGEAVTLLTHDGSITASRLVPIVW